MDQISNPYISDSGQPLLRSSVVAFVDILGYKELITKSNNSQGTLNKLHTTLQKGHQLIDPSKRNPFIIKLGVKNRYTIRAFTDNVVIGYPIKDDAEVELGSIFSHLSYFQMTLTMEGFFVRGAISIGELYMDDITVFGDGLIEAYEGEKALARDPRIILTESARKSVNQHLSYYGYKVHAPQVNDLLKDADGQFFINYLTTLYPEKGYLYLDELLSHKKAIEDKLSYYMCKPSAWNKYLWSASYHNYWCKGQQQVDDNYIIDLSRYNLSPTNIVET